jgi:hypothetical protein
MRLTNARARRRPTGAVAVAAHFPVARTTVLAVLATYGVLLSCNGSHTRIADAGPTLSDAAAAGPPAVADAGPPPDETMPPETSDELTTRTRHLLEAIAKDDAQLATDIQFPRDGWLLTHDAADPGKDWETHVAGPFRRAVHGLSRHHKEFDRAELVSIEVGRTMVQVTPKKHGWKKALWTVRESRITFVVDGRTRTLPIREMTAWRGAWYVTRLR